MPPFSLRQIRSCVYITLCLFLTKQVFVLRFDYVNLNLWMSFLFSRKLSLINHRSSWKRSLHTDRGDAGTTAFCLSVGTQESGKT